MELLAVSISHENTPISIREKVSFTKKKQAEILKYIKQNIAEECVLLSTCNRCEFYLAGYNMKDKFIDCLVSPKYFDTVLLQWLPRKQEFSIKAFPF